MVVKINNCQVFTPEPIVEQMLNLLQYSGDVIKTKTIFEPSFGDGAFLVKIVERMLIYAKQYNLSPDETNNVLDNLYGVEKDKKYYDIAIQRLDELLKQYNITHVWKNLVCDDTLRYQPPVKFDICVANPPYQKNHHLSTSTKATIQKQFRFGVGNTDLYVIFMEYCFATLSDTGKLCFITPNSYFKNSSQASLRKYLVTEEKINTLIDYSKVKVFGNIATYTAILFVDRTQLCPETKYVKMSGIATVEYSTNVNLKLFGENPWTFAMQSDIVFLEEVKRRKIKLKDLCDVQHGIATNADKVYIISKNNIHNIESKLLRPATKASTLNSENKILFPYQWNNAQKRFEVIPEEIIQSQYPMAYKYLTENRQFLENRDMEKNTMWYQNASSQGIQNSNNKKFALKHIISNGDKVCEFKELGMHDLVYSGVYIVVKNDTNYNLIKRILSSEEFHKYLFLVGKDMAGGYRNVSAKFIKEYGIPSCETVYLSQK